MSREEIIALAAKHAQYLDCKHPTLRGEEAILGFAADLLGYVADHLVIPTPEVSDSDWGAFQDAQR